VRRLSYWRSIPPSAARWLRSLVCIALAAATLTPAHALTPRAVLVVVKIESDQFRRGLGEAQAAQIESTIAAEVAASLAQQFPLVDWLVTAGADPPVGRLTAAVTEKPTAMMPEIKLEWRAEINGNPLPMPSVFPQILYSASNADRPVHNDRGAFVVLLQEKVVGWAQADTNHLRGEFLKNVPLATSVTLEPGRMLVVIPVPWRESRLGEESEFRVSYIGGTAELPEQTRVMLSGVALRLLDPLQGNTQSHVIECTLGGARVDAAQLWDVCVDPLSTTPQRRLLVNIEDYVYDAQSGVLFDGFVSDDHGP
jgi:hypothetical protein